MISRLAATGLAGIAATLLCTSLAEAKCRDDFQYKYLGGRMHKAFAITRPGSLQPNYNGPAASCGWSFNQPSRALAIRMALDFCESGREKADRRGACRVVKSQ
jgi:hypothetical protein